MCSGDLEYEKVGKALICVFGGDHRPNARDLARAGGSNKDEAYYKEDDEEWYEEFMAEESYEPEWYDDEAYFEDDDDEVPRVQMDGKTHALQQTQNYEPGFVKKAAKAIYNAMDKAWMRKQMMTIVVTEEVEEQKSKDKEINEEEKQMAKTHPQAAKSIVEKLHRQLGHPGRDRLVVAEREGGFDESVEKAAKDFKCDVCQHYRSKNPSKPAALPLTKHFNDALEKDVFHI